MNWLPTCDAEETDALFSLPEMFAVQRGARLTVLSQTDSTNHVLRDLVLAGAPQGQAVISLEQSAGKGRQGKRFFSPRGGLYLSYYMALSRTAQDCTEVTCGVAVALCRVLERVCGAQPTIKWVNDVLLHGKKVAGILVQRLPDAPDMCSSRLLIGVGVNVAPVSFSPPLSDFVTSLCAAGFPCTLQALACALLEELDTLTDVLQAGKEEQAQDYHRQYRLHFQMIGKQIRILDGTRTREAKVLDLLPDYGLLVREQDGSNHVLYSGEISVRGMTGYAPEQ